MHRKGGLFLWLAENCFLELRIQDLYCCLFKLVRAILHTFLENSGGNQDLRISKKNLAVQDKYFIARVGR